ncbi:MAG: fused MFS/spermidine synthase [Firmicutes bacterium]|nr:fused MFS/spermidine synthase [Bacillota bacterium]
MVDFNRWKKLIDSNREQLERMIQSGETTRFKAKSRFNRISVVDKSGIRMLKFDNMTQTAVDIEDGYRNRLKYIDYLHLPMAFTLDPARVLIIGLGGGALPRRMWMDYPRLSISVVEIDPKVVEVAYVYFDLPRDPRLSVFVDDGREYLGKDQTVYDQIIIDAFNTDSIPSDLITDGFMRTVKAHLGADGVMAINVIGAVGGTESFGFESIKRTVSRIWDRVFTFPIGIHKTGDLDRVRNIIMVATDQEVDAGVIEDRVKGRAQGRVSVPGFEEFYKDLL